MGTMKGWETRRRRQAEREREWDESVAAAAREDERSRLQPLLERCEGAVDRLRDLEGGLNVKTDALLLDLRLELDLLERQT